MKWFETKYLLWYYGNTPKNRILDKIGERLNRKLVLEQEREYFNEQNR